MNVGEWLGRYSRMPSVLLAMITILMSTVRSGFILVIFN